MTSTIPLPSPELAPILERLRVRLLDVPTDALYETAKAVPMWVAASFNKKGVRSEPVAFATKWKDAVTLGKALKKGSLEILECALWVVEAIDRGRALEAALAIRALPPPMLDLKYQHEKTEHFESLVRDRALYVVSRGVDALPTNTVVALAGRGDLLVSVAQEALTKHPALQEGSAILAALQTTGTAAADLWRASASPSPRDADLARYLVRRLIALRYEPAVTALGLRLGDGLLQIESPQALELLARAVEDGTLDANDPSLPARETAIRALFLLDPTRAYDRLARYLDEATITSEPAKAMVLALIKVLTLDRKARVAGQGPSYYDTDPRWAALIARMAPQDPDWERYAWNFQDLSIGEIDKKIQAWERRHKRRIPTA